jgi:endonuclease YncB( thermonuclease family)
MPSLRKTKTFPLIILVSWFFLSNACNSISVLRNIQTSVDHTFDGVIASISSQSEGIDAYLQIPGIDCIPDLSRVQTGTVVEVIDGDSITVDIEGTVFDVRYIGVNTPEYDSNERQQAEIATQANRKLVEGKTVYLFKDQSETDKYGRLLRYILTDQVFVNLELVKGGYAKAKEYPPDTACHQIFAQAVK